MFNLWHDYNVDGGIMFICIKCGAGLQRTEKIVEKRAGTEHVTYRCGECGHEEIVIEVADRAYWK